MFIKRNLGVMGFGNMGEAIIGGALDRQIVQRENVYVSDARPDRVLYARNKYDINAAGGNKEIVSVCDIILLCVKPQDLKALAQEISRPLKKGTLIISILAGVPTKRLESYFKKKPRVVRVMPNMSATVFSGISAISAGKSAVEEDIKTAEMLFRAVGDTVKLEEELQDAVTAVSGSGPAYFFYLTELLIKSAVEMGIEPEKARLLAVKTALGSGRLLDDSSQAPDYLRKKVTSKGGTTEVAFKVFEKSGLDKIFKKALSAAAKRAKDISKG
jgi:pyrroline-5-carboxylate reductase